MSQWHRTDRAHSSLTMETPQRVAKDTFLDYAKGLRFPWLVAITAFLFIADLFLLDPIPFVDEILLGLLTIIFASLKKRRREQVIEGKALENKPTPLGAPESLPERDL